MNPSDPLVSIIIPAYNKAALTVKTVESVLAQTYRPIEIIVIDDGSTDDTAARLAGYTTLQYVYKRNGGACSARNAGIRLAKGKYFGFLDCDDLYKPDKVKTCVEFLEDHPGTGLVHTAADFIDAEGRVTGRYAPAADKKTDTSGKRLIFGNYICNSTVMVRRDCLEQAGDFDESIFMPADWDLWLRLAEVAGIGYIDEPLTQYRVTDNYILPRLAESEREEEIVIRKCLARNRRGAARFQKAVFSSMHLRYAQCYFVQDNFKRCKEEFLACLRNRPFNPKAIGLFLYFLFAPRQLNAQLRRKILRVS